MRRRTTLALLASGLLGGCAGPLSARSLRGRRFDMRLALRNQVAPGA